MLLTAYLRDFAARCAAFFRPGRSRLQRLRDSWGKEEARERDFVLIASYHDLKPVTGPIVDDTTWKDLALDEVFAMMDRTRSAPGRQMLYHQLHTYQESDRVLAERARQYAIFREDADLREKLQLQLAHLEHQDASWLAPLLMHDLPPRPWFTWLLFLVSLASLGSLAGLFFHPLFLAPVLLLIPFNIFLNETYGRRISPYLPGFSQLEKLLGICVELAVLPDPHRLPELRRARAAAPMAAALRRRISWLVVDRTTIGDIGTSFIGYLNMFLLLDILVFVRAITPLRRHQEELIDLLEAVASLDAAISVASYLEGLPHSTVPVLGRGRELRLRDAYHPLVAAPVGNDLDPGGRSVLITGSNMAGKTTFMRTVGLNLILARTLNIALAREALLPRAVVASSIRREDSLQAGQSYYFAELERLLAFIRAGDGESLHLFLIDEIFRGTNTTERIAASAAVLEHLGRRHLVVVTTHDLELQGMLGDAYQVSHFSEQIVDGQCRFSYRIQPGPCTSRAAIRLLEINGYPERIIRRASALADGIADYRLSHGLDVWRTDDCLECPYLPLCFGGCRLVTLMRHGAIDRADCRRAFYDATLERFVLQDLRYQKKESPSR